MNQPGGKDQYELSNQCKTDQMTHILVVSARQTFELEQSHSFRARNISITVCS